MNMFSLNYSGLNKIKKIIDFKILIILENGLDLGSVY